MKNRKAFTLIELLVVIAIIGILATISVIVLQNARAKSRDAKRAGDMKQVQTAMELFFNDKGRYPTASEWLTGQIFSTTTEATTTYMQIIPAAATPADGACTTNQNTFSYTQNEAGNSYSVSFCLGGTTGNLTPGPKCLTPGGMLDVDCSSGGGGTPAWACGDSISYGGQSYGTVLIGSECWFSENLNIGTRINAIVNQGDYTSGIQKYCYGDNVDNCPIYGGLYQWHMAVGLPQTCDAHTETAPCILSGDVQGICPTGWHIPSDAELVSLLSTVGSDPGGKLKEAGVAHWTSETCGAGACNTSGFTARGGGQRYYNGTTFGYVNMYTWYWSSNLVSGGSYNAWFLYLEDSSTVIVHNYELRTYGFSVRCLMN
jgi:uncharacterized protein (TIGR02145 family)/prepilin-type N-terminal cleavage/methylation domain-containing protein